MGKIEWSVTLETRGALPGLRGAEKEILSLAADSARCEWIKAAKNRLRTTAKVYIDAIQPPIIKGRTATIKLKGWLPNALEEGHPPFDMKKGLLKGPHAKKDKKGRPYNIVPIPVKSFGSIGGTPPVMPRPIYRMASQLKFGENLTLPRRYQNYAIRTRFSPDIRKWDHYTWKSSPFQNVTRIAKFSGDPMSRYIATGGPRATRRPGYVSFRMVSRNSDPNSWIHPGFRRHDIMETAVTGFERSIPDILNRILGA